MSRDCHVIERQISGSHTRTHARTQKRSSSAANTVSGFAPRWPRNLVPRSAAGIHLLQDVRWMQLQKSSTHPQIVRSVCCYVSISLPVQDITSPWSPVVLRHFPAHILRCSFCTPTKCWPFFHQHGAWWKILQNKNDAYLKISFAVSY